MLEQLNHKIRQVLPKLQGWCTPEKALAMANLIIQTKPKTLVEIGVFGGRSVIAMAMACKHIGNGVVHGIDPWTKDASLLGTHDAASNEWWAKVDYEAIYKDFLIATIKLDLTKFLYAYRTTSEKAVGAFDDIDVLHIDGNHSEEVAKKDVTLYYPKVRAGGYIWFDDTDWATTKNAWAILEKKCKRVALVGHCALYQKK